MDKELFIYLKKHSEDIIKKIKKEYSSVIEIYNKNGKRLDYWKDIEALFNSCINNMVESKDEKCPINNANKASTLFVSLLNKNLFEGGRKSIIYKTSVFFAWRMALCLFYYYIQKEDDSIPDDYFQFLENNDYLGEYLQFTKDFENKFILPIADKCFDFFHNKSLSEYDDYKWALNFAPKFSQFEQELFKFFEDSRTLNRPLGID